MNYPKSPEHKVLEVFITSNLKWSAQLRNRSVKAGRAFYHLKNHIPWNKTQSTELTLHKSFVGYFLFPHSAF